LVIANKIKFPQPEALALARRSPHVWAARGKKLIKLDLTEGVSDDELAKVILGRSGTLRAPAIRVSEVFMVGFNAEAYSELFG